MAKKPTHKRRAVPGVTFTKPGGQRVALKPPPGARVLPGRPFEGDSTSIYGQLPPPGTFDPQLEASLRASDRGLAQFLEDTRRAGSRALQDYKISRSDASINRTRGRRDLATNKTRATEDFTVAGADIDRDAARSWQDLTRTAGRGLEDIGTQRGYATEDAGTGRTRLNENIDRQLAELTRSHQQRSNQQDQQARVAGVARGGYAQAAAAKRAENLAFDRAPIDQARTRGMQDIDTSLGRTLAGLDLSGERLTEDFGTSRDRLGENKARAWQGLNTDYSRGMADIGREGRRLEQDYTRLLGPKGKPLEGRLGLGYTRGVEDRQTAQQRAQTENREFGQDVAGSAYYQARYGAGTLPIWNPSHGGPRRRDPYKPRRRR